MSNDSIGQLIVAPDWLDINDPEMVLSSNLDFCAVVNWRGKGLYAVNQGLYTPASMFLSRAGNWAFQPLRMQKRQYRFTWDEAVDWAHKVVAGEGLKNNGFTKKEWDAHFARQK